MDVITPAQNRDRKGAGFATYLLTFACHGTHLPGRAGTVDRSHNLYGSRVPEPNAAEEQRAGERMRQMPYSLDVKRRPLVLASIQEVCRHRSWTLVAAHVRTTHIHAVVSANRTPEFVMNTLKAYASRALDRAALDPPNSRHWARHGSTRYLWTSAAVSAAVHYVVCEQGEPMAVFEEVSWINPLPYGRGSVSG